MMRHAITAAGPGLCALFLWVSCSPVAEGLAPTPPGNGPSVVWDLTVKPLPEIPFPNNVATRGDPASATGIRLNISAEAATEIEGEIREKADELDGFGTYTPITVAFDGPLDLEALHERHAGNLDFGDDAVFVFDVTPDSPDFGQPVMLDMGRGFFPLQLRDADAYFIDDPRAGESNLLFDTVDEGDGPDTDFDGVKDVPNVYPAGGDPWDDLLTWYERETDTLLLRPVVPLRERTTYAVVITSRVVDANGNPVRSPFPYVHHADQTEDLAPLEQVLPGVGLSLEDVAFSWVFTTQSITDTLKAIREGLYGWGSMAYLADEFPAEYELAPLKTEAKALETGSLYVIPVAELLEVAGPLIPLLGGIVPSLADSVDALIETFDHVDFLVGGYYRSPHFLVDRDGMATEDHPADDDESFLVDPVTGAAAYGTTRVPFVCAIPHERADYLDPTAPDWTIERPFPVAVFVPGTASNKFQGLGYAGPFARVGIATCAIDTFAHGMPFPNIPTDMGGLSLSEDMILDLVGQMLPDYLPIFPFLKGNRTRDLNMDGNLDPAGDFWTMDAFHTRDTVRQTVVDYMQLIRVLRAMDGTTTADVDGDGEQEVLGDFDGDGRPDIGGPDNRYFAWGISLGGIVTGVLAGAEPALDGAVVQAGGAGLIDVAQRSSQIGVPQMAVLPVLGPLFAFDPDPEGEGMVVSTAVPQMDHVDIHPVVKLEEARFGNTVVLANLDSGETREALVPREGGFRLQVQADALRATEIRYHLGFDTLLIYGGEACETDEDCPEGLLCGGDVCTCGGDGICPTGTRCLDTGKCVFAPQPLDTTLATADHPPLGDRIGVAVLDPDGVVLEAVETFHFDVTVNGVVYKGRSQDPETGEVTEGQTLVNLFRGFGYERQTPGFRRFLGLAQAIVDPGDPANWARHYFAEPLDYSQSDPAATPGTPVMVVGVCGDNNVPLATGISLARAAGIVGYQAPDPRLGGRTPMEVLVDRDVTEALYNRCRYAIRALDKDYQERNYCVLYDVDDLDGSRKVPGCDFCDLEYDGESVSGWVCTDATGTVCGDGFGIPFTDPEPLRATAVPGPEGTMEDAHPGCEERHADGTCRVFRDPAGVGALRIVMTAPQGFHGMYLMAPYKPFDIETYQMNLFARYFMTGGTEVTDDVCLEDYTCPWIP